MGLGELMTAIRYIAVPIIWLAVFCVPPPSGAGLSAEAEAHFFRENYEESLILLEEVPGTARSAEEVRLLGLTYYHILQYHQALPLLEEVLAAAPDDYAVGLALAEVHLGLNMLEDASVDIAKLESNHPEAWQVIMLRGRLCQALEQLECSMASFKVVLTLEPGRACQVALELVDLMVTAGDLAGAQKTASLALKTDPSSFYARELQGKLKELQTIGQVAEKQKPYLVHTGYRLEHDNYLLVDSVDLAVVAEGDWRQVLTAGVSGYHGLRKDRYIYGELRFYQSIHQDLEQYDQRQIYGLTGIKFHYGDYEIRLPVEYVERSLDDEFYHSAVSLVPDIGFHLTKRITLYGLFKYQDDRYPDVGREAEKRSGSRTRVGLLLRTSFARQRGWFNISLMWEDKSGAGNNWTYGELQLNNKVAFRLSPKVDLGLSLMYGDQQFDNQHDFYLVTRQDNYLQLMPEVSYNPTGRWKIKIHGILIDRDSSIRDYSYNRQIFGLGVVYHF